MARRDKSVVNESKLKESEIIYNITIGRDRYKNEEYFEKVYPKFHNKIKELNLGRNWKETFYMYVKNINVIPTCECGTQVEYQSFSKGYREFCSRKCMTSSSKLKERRASTNLEKYGTEIVLKSEAIKEKIKQTNIEKYGVGNPSKSQLVKDKVKATNRERFGYDYVSQRPEVKEILSENMKKNIKSYIQVQKEKYGEGMYNSTEEGRKKYEETCLRRYGVNNISKDINIRKGKFLITNDKYYVRYLSNGISEFKCDCGKDHTYLISSLNWRSRDIKNIPKCTICYPIGEHKSIKEKELLKYIKEVYDGEVISGYRDKLEVDIYLPELNVGFEFNGLYWHSDKFTNKNAHLDKQEYFLKKGIQIIYIWEDDWDYKKEIIKSKINNILNININEIKSDKCEIREIRDINIVENFLIDNHIDEFINFNIALGLYNNTTLISIMTFIKESDCYILSRFCDILNTNVINSEFKLLEYFIKNYDKKSIISYSDKNWNLSNLYLNLGFKLKESIEPSYRYIVNKKRLNKNESINSNYTYKVYDCGQMKFEMVI